MSMVEKYMAKVYPSPPCWELVADVLTTERGKSVEAYKTITGNLRATARAFSLHLRKSPHGLAQIAEPVDFAVVLMGRSEKLGLHHAGIYYEGKVLHAQDSGTLYQDLASLKDEYPVMEFWSRDE